LNALKIRTYISFALSIIEASLAYYLYFNFLSGLNPFLAVVFFLPLIASLATSIFLIVKEKLARKRIALIFFMAVCFAISAFVIRLKVDSLKKGNGLPRRYLTPP